MTNRHAVGLGLVLAALLVAVYVLGQRDVRVVAEPSIVGDLPPVGTYQYVHIDGPLLLAWDTRTGAYKLCLVRPGERGMIVDCGNGALGR